MITKKDKIEAIKFFNYGVKKNMNPFKLFLRFFKLWDEEKDEPNEEYLKLLEKIYSENNTSTQSQGLPNSEGEK